MCGESIEWQGDLPPEGQQRRETFARFGLAVYQAQCIERQIGILLATTLSPSFLIASPEERDRFFDTEFSKTLGHLVTALRTRTSLNPDLESRLVRALELRNWLAHDYFWERAGSLLTWNGREKMIAELQEAADFLGSLDDELTAFSERWLAIVGVPKELLEAELEKYRNGQNV